MLNQFIITWISILINIFADNSITIYTTHVSDSLVIIPTYNEKENIEKIIRKVFSLNFSFEVLIIDDGSPDGTADIVKKLQQEFPGLHM